MKTSGALGRQSVNIAGAGVFGVLAAILTVARLEIPFPALTYLKVDFAEVPVVIAFFVFGPYPGILTSVVQWVFLSTRPTDPLGPTLKFLAVLSMLIGFWAGSKLSKSFNFRSPKGSIVLMLTSGIFVRVAVMSIVNLIVLTYIAPVVFGIDYLRFAASTLHATIGLSSAGTAEVLLYTLIFTGVYNAVHVFVSAIPSYAIVMPLQDKLTFSFPSGSWLHSLTRKK